MPKARVTKSHNTHNRRGWLISEQKCFQLLLKPRIVHVLSQLNRKIVPHARASDSEACVYVAYVLLLRYKGWITVTSRSMSSVASLQIILHRISYCSCYWCCYHRSFVMTERRKHCMTRRNENTRNIFCYLADQSSKIQIGQTCFRPFGHVFTINLLESRITIEVYPTTLFDRLVLISLRQCTPRTSQVGKTKKSALLRLQHCFVRFVPHSQNDAWRSPWFQW